MSFVQVVLVAGALAAVLAVINALVKSVRGDAYKDGRRDQRIDQLEKIADDYAKIIHQVPPLLARCDKNFNEVMSSWIEMKARISSLETVTKGMSQPWGEMNLVRSDTAEYHKPDLLPLDPTPPGMPSCTLGGQ